MHRELLLNLNCPTQRAVPQQSSLHKGTTLSPLPVICLPTEKHGPRSCIRSQKFYGKLAVDVLACDQLLIPNCSMQIRLTRNKPEDLLQIAVANAAFTLKNERMSVFARYYTVAENYHVNIQ